jgi:hypothetical protein
MDVVVNGNTTDHEYNNILQPQFYKNILKNNFILVKKVV